MNEGKSMDFSKAFDSASHSRMYKLAAYGLDGYALCREKNAWTAGPESNVEWS